MFWPNSMAPVISIPTQLEQVPRSRHAGTDARDLNL
jgi:hypothetical protein